MPDQIGAERRRRWLSSRGLSPSPGLPALDLPQDLVTGRAHVPRKVDSSHLELKLWAYIFNETHFEFCLAIWYCQFSIIYKIYSYIFNYHFSHLCSITAGASYNLSHGSKLFCCYSRPSFLSSTWYHMNFIFGEPTPTEANNNIVSISVFCLMPPKLNYFLLLAHPYLFVIYLLHLWDIVNFLKL